MAWPPRLWSCSLTGLLLGIGTLAVAADSPVLKSSVNAARPASAHKGAIPKLQEATTSGPYCGVYSLWSCLNALDVKSDPKELALVDYIGSHQGSSAAELMKAAEHCGVYAKGFTQLTLADLERSDSPMVLHMRGNWMDQTYNHWVGFLGIERNRVRLFDPPHPINTVSYAELLANWDGFALVVSTSPIDNSLVYAARVDYAIKVIALLCIVYLFRLLLKGSEKDCFGQGWQLHCRRLGRQAVSLVAVAAAWGVGYHSLAEIGFLRNPTAVAEVTRRYYSADIPEQTLTEMKSLVEKGGCVIVNARRTEDFRGGAIPGAISIPVSSTLPERQQALRGISPSSPIIVYCQSARCRYSDGVAAFLKFNGYTNLSIYRGGYHEWRTHTGAPAQDESAKGMTTTEKKGDTK